MSENLPLSLPSELLACVRGLGFGWHLRLLSGLSSLVGETHLIGTKDGGLHVYARSSMLAPFDEVVGVTRLEILRSTLRTELRLVHDFGADEHTLPLGYREVEELVIHLDGESRDFDARGAHTPNEPTPLPPPPEPGAYVPAMFGAISAWSPPASQAPVVSTDPGRVDPTSARRHFVHLLYRRATQLRARTIVGVPFASLLEGEVPRQSRRALLDARDYLERGRRDEALATLASSARSARWHVRVGYAQVLLADGQAKNALLALDEADKAGAPPDATIALREDAARELGTRRELLLALRKKRKHLARERLPELDHEIERLETEGKRLREQRAERQRANEAAKAARLQARAERRRIEREGRPPAPPKATRPKKVKASVDPNAITLDPPGRRALRPLEPLPPRARSRGPALSADVKPEMHMGWIIAAVVLAAALFAYVQQRRSEPKLLSPNTATQTTIPLRGVGCWARSALDCRRDAGAVARWICRGARRGLRHERGRGRPTGHVVVHALG